MEYGSTKDKKNAKNSSPSLSLGTNQLLSAKSTKVQINKFNFRESSSSRP
jgi:hypothetical protein